ncbi:hypothetical protein LOZ53_001460 [Ophidiomyces ophidiicola]|nr:hypothetical protein LOZ62_003044 [Ophidiomyces ophidiicola]KAI1971345.1 hypothetical protein LOZ55_006230 [Ophidiomyces ophidiicola]KAI1995100.1 hypothetical protein LOZ54_000771 [Ophidiomyces ophidiicola]KAI1995230.1 hypothetical protein LOZ53_001460 [Ophidiomyces ophidiicola]KAI1999082.1 hypothetical protein LOZ51_001567 [Ophidiomyces ophidiicola]
MLSFLWYYCSTTWAAFRRLVRHPLYLPLHVFEYITGENINASPPAGSTPNAKPQALVALTLPNAEAAQWNRETMREFEAALEANPAVDLMSLFSDSYRGQHRAAQYDQLSYPGGINLQMVNSLRDTLQREPEVNLLSAFPVKFYTRRIKMATFKAPEKLPPSKEPEFRQILDRAKTASVVFPLSEAVTSLLAQSGASTTDDAEESLFVSLNRLLWDSPTIWQQCVRGMVVRCNEDIVAKVISGNKKNYTEYTSMQFLEQHAPDIPAPRPHGLIDFEPFQVIFMTYIPDMTLTEAWPDLSHDEKLSIQRQLDDIFRRLRSIRQDDGNMLGGVCAEGVRELRVDECALFKDITRAIDYNNLQFSADHRGSATYAELLRLFLENERPSVQGSVFTHGDVRTDNIMVKRDPNGCYKVTGIIDWELSGFYPEYYECTALTRTLSFVDDNDWYLYLPESLSPMRFPIRWLVDRLWGLQLRMA